MTTHLKSAHAIQVVFVMGTLFATATVANAAEYEFKIMKAGQAPTIELVNTTTGQVVSGADIDVVHTVHLAPQKGVPNIQLVFVPLQTYLSGKDAYLRGKSPASGEITLWASVPGEFWPIWRTVDLGN